MHAKCGLPFIVFNTLVFATDASAHHDDLIRRVDDAVSKQEANLASYSDTEHYVLRNSRLKQAAEMTIRTKYGKDAGRSFEVILETGPSLVRGRVFKELLNEAQCRSHGEMKKKTLVTSENYIMRLAGRAVVNNRPCYILDLSPKRRAKYLLSGRAWVLAEDYSLVRLEGNTAASVSFWTGKSFIVREYEEVEGFWVTKTTRAISKNWLTGQSELTIDHSGYHIVVHGHDGE